MSVVVGRVVDLHQGGKAIIQTPPGRDPRYMTQTELALVLAVRAYKRNPNQETSDALKAAIDALE